MISAADTRVNLALTSRGSRVQRSEFFSYIPIFSVAALFTRVDNSVEKRTPDGSVGRGAMNFIITKL